MEILATIAETFMIYTFMFLATIFIVMYIALVAKSANNIISEKAGLIDFIFVGIFINNIINKYV
tara:strand:+ start:104 stop:295 length:192 start_codon:yes stop_codon:yes gene_type:complete